jgi:hypothetical protein
LLLDLVSREFIVHQFVPKLTTRTYMPPTPLLAFPRRHAFGAFAPGHGGNEGTQKNPYFALWTVYKNGEREQFITEDWHPFLLQQLGTECTEEIEFARAMAELDKLLTLFHDENRVLPGLSFERISSSWAGPARVSPRSLKTSLLRT